MKNSKKLIFMMLLLIFSLMNLPVYAKENFDNNTNLIITYKNNNTNKIEQFVKNSGGQVICRIPEFRAIEVKCNPSLIPKFKNCSNIKSIEFEPTIKLQQYEIKNSIEPFQTNTEKADLYNKYQWDIKKVTNNGKSFDIESGNHNVVVGIIDTGVNKSHDDLKDNFLGGANLVPKGFEDDKTETGNPKDVEDRVGHGTHVAGTIAANGRVKGVAPNVGFKAYRVFNKYNHTNASIIASAIIKATNDKVNVINLSVEGYYLKGKCLWTDPNTNKTYNIGDNTKEYSLYEKAINYAIDHGVTVVASAGNDSLDCSKESTIVDYLNKQYKKQGFKYTGVGYELPGNIKGVITVSSIGIDNKISFFSNYGENFIDITSPGGSLGNTSKTYSSSACFNTYLNNSYTFMKGTSMAVPKVSAVAALIICKYGNIGSEKVSEKIYNSAIHLKNKDSDKYFGHGLVNAYDSLTN